MPPRLLTSALALFAAASAAAASEAPVIIAPAPTQNLRAGTAGQTLDLNTIFRDPYSAGTTVRLSVRIGTNTQPVDLLLYDAQKPITTTNFLSYVNSGRFVDNLVHRSVPGFVVQGGGFRWTSDVTISTVPTFEQIQNEPGLLNVRGTIAMAKLGDQPNSATSQWFINLADNANLDEQNGGFTVFGRVTNGMEVIDNIASLPRKNASSFHPAFNEIPLTDLSGSPFTRAQTVETDAAVLPLLSYTAISSDSSRVNVSVNGSILSLTPALTGAGSSTITITATDLTGDSTPTTFLVNVAADTQRPTISTPSPQVLTSTSGGQMVVPDYRGTVTVADDVGVQSFTQTPAPGSQQAIGLQPLVFTALDAAGNTTTVQTTLSIIYPAGEEPAVVPGAAFRGAALPAQGSTGLPPSSTFYTFGEPAVSDFRDLAARVTILAEGRVRAGLYGESGDGTTRLYAFQSQPSGVPGGLFLSFRDPVLSPGGAVAFRGKLQGVPAANDEGVWTDLFGDSQPVLREGKELPGLGGLKLKSVTSMSLEGEALLAVVKLQLVPGSVTAANDTALIRLTGPATGTLLARTGTLFDGSKITLLSVLQPGLLPPGQGRWQNRGDTLARFTLADHRSVLVRLSAQGAATALLQSGAVEPRLGTRLTVLGLPAAGGAGLAVLATEAVNASVTATNDTQILLAPDGSTFGVAVRENDPVATPAGARFATLTDPVLNAQGELLFRATLRNAGAATNKISLWTKAAGVAPNLLARQGELARGTAGEPLANTFWATFTSYVLGDEPRTGPLFVATLTGAGTTPANRLGLWMRAGNNLPRLLLRTGQSVTLPDGEPGSVKKLASFSLFKALPGSFGVRRSYSQAGSVAVLATFTDKSQALLRLDLPE